MAERGALDRSREGSFARPMSRALVELSRGPLGARCRGFLEPRDGDGPMRPKEGPKILKRKPKDRTDR
eukprot:6426396-Pyramimonas_sp.AAC.1